MSVKLVEIPFFFLFFFLIYSSFHQTRDVKTLRCFALTALHGTQNTLQDLSVENMV